MYLRKMVHLMYLRKNFQFFVCKENCRLRFVLDCSAVNSLFRPSEVMPLGPGAVWTDYFFACGLPLKLLGWNGACRWVEF